MLGIRHGTAFKHASETLEGEEVILRLNSSHNSQLLYLIYLRDGTDSIGYCDLRLGHSKSLYYYGNIGYRIRKAYRGHGYAAKAVRLLLPVARECGMDHLIITASPENRPSIRTIEKLGAEFVETVEVPAWHPLFMSEKIKNIYRLEL